MRSEPNTKLIDASVGGLVWVRRRNGSWWPGRIMGLHELSESCLVSPRSGTPVKLLGREDASVDWYNLEKSKRVKAFRCGEYDDCIEKAKASAALSNKKAVKYARREDAILHALELESLHESVEHHVLQLRAESSADTKHDSWMRQPQSTFSPGKEHEYMDGKGSIFEVNSAQDLSQSGISFEDPNHISTSKSHYLQRKRRKTPNDSEDDGTEGTKRMRGLEDLGMGVASKRKANICFHTEGSHELVQLDGASLSDANICNVLFNEIALNSSKGSSMKSRQSQLANVYGNLKRKNRRRPLTKVLESTTMVSVPVLCDEGASPGQSSLQRVVDSKASALESIDSKKTNVSVVVNNNSDCTGASCERETSLNASEHTCDAAVDNMHIHSESKDTELSSMSEFPQNDCSDGLFDVPFVGEEKHTEGLFPLFASCASRKFQFEAMGKQSNGVGSIPLGSEGLDESGSTSFSNVSPRIEKGISKWQLKGKRNSRSLGKKTSRSLDSGKCVDQGDESDAFLVGAHHVDGLSVGFSHKVEMADNSAHWSNHIAESSYLDSINYGGRNSINIVMQPTERRDKSVIAKSTTQVRNKELHLPRGVPVSPLTSSQRPLLHHQSCFATHSKYQIADVPNRNVSVGSLFDVNLEVQASYRGHHVPLVSLMSKLNGKAIVGHPLTVEVQDDGYCDLLLSNIDCCPTSISGELYDVSTENMSDQSMDVTSSSILLDGGAKVFGTPRAKTGYAVKSHIESRSPIQYSSYLKKSPKVRKCGLLSKKTRKLSSFISTHEQREENRKPAVEKMAGPVVACVPLKVVFSRINEAVNC